MQRSNLLGLLVGTALAVLLECRRDALAHQKTLSIQDLPPALAGMAALYGVDSLLPAHASGV